MFEIAKEKDKFQSYYSLIFNSKINKKMIVGKINDFNPIIVLFLTSPFNSFF